MPDYNNGKIYRIWCITGECDDVYVGSTTQSLAKRWGAHKTHSRKETHQHYKIYQAIAGDWEAWKIELIELYPCASRMELERREGELIRETGTLNEKIAGRTPKEYYQDNKEAKHQYYEQNKEAIAETKRQYYQQNASAIAEKQRQYIQQNAEAIAEKARQKYQQNKDVMVERKRQYYKQNKEAISERSHKKYQQNAEVIKEKSRQYREKNAEAVREKQRQRYHKRKAEKEQQ